MPCSKGTFKIEANYHNVDLPFLLTLVLDVCLLCKYFLGYHGACATTPFRFLSTALA